jgi:hypothetical protein
MEVQPFEHFYVFDIKQGSAWDGHSFFATA